MDDLFEKNGAEGGGKAFLGDAQPGRVGLEQGDRQPAQQREVLGGRALGLSRCPAQAAGRKVTIGCWCLPLWNWTLCVNGPLTSG
jgi:hypothetical protein